MNKLKELHQYFRSHKKTTLIAMWVSFGVTFLYMILCMNHLLPTSFWWWFIGGAFALYFRLAYSKASYDPQKDKFSDQYVPYKDRKKQK